MIRNEGNMYNQDHPTVEQMHALFSNKYPSIDIAPDAPMLEWQQLIDSATSFANLESRIKEYAYAPLVGEAMHCLQRLTEDDWLPWQDYVSRNRAAAKGEQVQFDNNEMQRFACIIAPPTLLHITMVADRFIAPFVVAMEQMARADILHIKGKWLTVAATPAEAKHEV